MFRAIIVDDEQAARRSIEILLQQNFENITVAGQFESVNQAITFLEDNPVQIVFLDIEMPQDNGFKLLKHFPNSTFEVIFVTAYNQYAIQAFKHNAIDYLLKPIDAEEFRGAVNKAIERIKTNIDPRERYVALFESIEKMIARKLVIPSNANFSYVDMGTVVLAKLGKDSISFKHVDGSEQHIENTNKTLEETLLERGFVEIADKMFVNLHKVLKFVKIGKGMVMLEGGHSVEIESITKTDFIEKLTQFTVTL